MSCSGLVFGTTINWVGLKNFQRKKAVLDYKIFQSGGLLIVACHNRKAQEVLNVTLRSKN